MIYFCSVDRVPYFLSCFDYDDSGDRCGIPVPQRQVCEHHELRHAFASCCGGSSISYNVMLFPLHLSHFVWCRSVSSWCLGMFKCGTSIVTYSLLSPWKEWVCTLLKASMVNYSDINNPEPLMIVTTKVERPLVP